MRLKLAFGLALVLSAPACASPDEPVRNLLDAASHNFASGDHDFDDYFSQERLETIYSRDFVARYKAADDRAKQNDEGVLEGDMITGSDGGCPLKDIRIDVKPAKDGRTEVHTSFLPFTCMKGDPKQSETRKVIFVVKDEGGRTVIDDILATSSVKEKFDRYGR